MRNARRMPCLQFKLSSYASLIRARRRIGLRESAMRSRQLSNVMARLRGEHVFAISSLKRSSQLVGTWPPRASITASSPWPGLCSLCLSCHGRHRDLSAWLRPSLSIVCTAATALFAIKLTLSNIYIRTHCRTLGQCITVNGPLVLFRLDALTRRARHPTSS